MKTAFLFLAQYIHIEGERVQQSPRDRDAIGCWLTFARGQCARFKQTSARLERCTESSVMVLKAHGPRLSPVPRASDHPKVTGAMAAPSMRPTGAAWHRHGREPCGSARRHGRRVTHWIRAGDQDKDRNTHRRRTWHTKRHRPNLHGTFSLGTFSHCSSPRLLPCPLPSPADEHTCAPRCTVSAGASLALEGERSREWSERLRRRLPRVPHTHRPPRIWWPIKVRMASVIKETEKKKTRSGGGPRRTSRPLAAAAAAGEGAVQPSAQRLTD